MTASARSRVRCAIYTRKSSEEGLEQSFNSLQAQREACEAYIASQRHEGWHAVARKYDDGGFSGGNMNRPGPEAAFGRHCCPAGRYGCRLQGGPPDSFADGLCQDHRGLRSERGELRLRDPAVQYHQLHGKVDLERAVVVCPVRARGHGRADSGQDCRLQEERHVDGRGGRHLLKLECSFALARRRGELRLVLPDSSASTSPPTSPLLKAIVMAHGWKERIIAGQIYSIQQLAAEAKLNSRYAARILRLVALSPEIASKSTKPVGVHAVTAGS